ncbi:MAG: LPP20 family lipoprotein [Nitrospirae bacterium]|nr:LPP20 family lipoprotein [Nitrospirota bacterium]
MFVTRSAVFAIIVLILFTVVAGNASAQLAGTIKDVEQSVGSSGRVDWTTGVLTAVGIGAPPAQPANAAQARAMAERAAQVVAYRNLLEAVKGVRVDSTTTVENFIITSDVIRTEVSGIIQGATIMDKKYMSDGSVEVTVGMKLTGALAESLLPKTPPTPPTGLTGTLAPAAPGQLYTGLIVDARGLGVKPAMAPKILNEDGKEVYGSAWINRDYAVREGMVGYLKDPVQAQTNPRVTDKPLMVKAIKVAGDARVDMVITNADAAMLHSASENLSMLQKCRVIVLVD